MTFNTPEDLANRINPVWFDTGWLVCWLVLCAIIMASSGVGRAVS